MIMSSKKTLLKRAAAFTLAFVLAFTTLFTGSNTVTVSAASPVTKITPAKKSITIAPKKTTNIKVTVKGGNKKFTAKSSKKSVATVKVVGKKVRITAKKAGTATVTVTTKGKNKKGKKLKAKIKVNVKAADTTTTQQPTTQQPTTQQPATPAEKLEKITVTADTTTITENGGKATISVVSDPAGISIASVEYTSANEQIATVKDGVVTGVKPGDAVINVTAKDANGNPAKGSITITVTERNKYGAKISFTDKDKKKTLATDDEEKLIPIVGANEGVDVKTLKISWESDNENVATVDSDGTVTAVGAGSALITATVVGTDATATSTITVFDKADALSVSKVEVTHADTLRVNLTSPVKEDKRDDIEVLLKNGDKQIESFDIDWASDGKSFEIKNKTKYNTGTYTVEIKANEVPLGDTTSGKVDVAKREIKDIVISSAAIPYAKEVKVKFDIFDQYDDVRTDVQADAFDWYVTSPDNTSVTGVEDAVLETNHVGYIVINSALDGLIAGGDGRTEADKLEIRAAIKDKESKAGDRAKVPVYNLAIQSIKITGTVDESIEESKKDQNVYFTCEAKDSQGGDVDFEMYAWGAYTQSFYTNSYSSDKVSAPKIDKDGLYATVFANKSGKATIEVSGADQETASSYEFVIKKAGVAESIKFPAEEACNVIAGEVTKIPIKFIDNYGKERDNGFVTADQFEKLFDVISAGEQGKFAKIDYENGSDEDYLVVDARNVKAEDEDGNPSKITLTIKNLNTNTDSTFVLQVTDKRKPSKIVVTNEDKLKSSIMVGEEAKVEFTIKDNYDEDWTKGDYTVEVEPETSDYVTIGIPVINTQTGKGSITITGKAKTDLAVKDPSITLSLKDSDGEKILGTEYTYTVAVEDNLSKLKAEITNAPGNGKFTAGQDVEIKLTALDSDGKVLKNYDEKLKTSVAPNNNAKAYELIDDLEFKQGVATFKVKARDAGKEVKYTGEITSPGNLNPTSFTTDAVEIIVGDVDGYRIEVANKILTIKYTDSVGNVIDTYNEEVSPIFTITNGSGQDVEEKNYISGLDANNALKVKFNNGIANVTLIDNLPENYTITVKYSNLEGSKSITK